MSPASYREYRLPKSEGEDSLTVVEASIPTLKSSEVLVKIVAVSLQYRDTQVASGTYPPPIKENVVPCSDLAGIVADTGDAVKSWKAGDRVCVNFLLDHIDGDLTPETIARALGGPVDGVLREYIVVPDQSLVRIPEHLSFEEASTLPCAGITAYNALHGPKPVKAGDSVLVIGTGGVSIFALQFAVAGGATVIALSSSDEKLAKAKELGAKHVINYKKVDNWNDKVIELTNGRGVDHVIEVGGLGTLPKSIKSARLAGYVHVIGYLGGQADLPSLPHLLVQHPCFLRGIYVGSVHQFGDMNRAIAANEIRPVVDRVFEFEQAKEAYKYLKSQKHVGKVVIRVAKHA
jgi:NADPH:quinone reductase-like Zn-dependent oxidoreductase